jgi:hypothetical protein
MLRGVVSYWQRRMEPWGDLVTVVFSRLVETPETASSGEETRLVNPLSGLQAGVRGPQGPVEGVTGALPSPTRWTPAFRPGLNTRRR